jgi:hypothetical protein
MADGMQELLSRVSRTEEKFDNYLRSDAYERRHGELIERIGRLEASDLSLRSDFIAKFDVLNTTLGALTLRIEKIATSRWQWISGLALSFVVGSGGLYLLLDLVHALK